MSHVYVYLYELVPANVVCLGMGHFGHDACTTRECFEAGLLAYSMYRNVVYTYM